MSTHDIVPIADVHSRIDPRVRPTLRHLREDMARLGFAKRYGRSYATTPELAEAYIRGIVCAGTGQSGAPSSRTGGKSKGSGSRAGGSRSERPTVALPGDELSEALEALRAARAKASATSSTSSTRTARQPSASR